MTTLARSQLDQRSIDTIRTLCIDAIEAANSGHPGTPVGIAPVTYTLWQRFLAFDPSDPIWPNRDRFVLSAGHASALLWSLLHLTGVRSVDPEYEVLGEPAVTLDDLKRFRQLDSKCPGHPEYRWTSGVETTSGPLGQGVATSVGMAVASKWLGGRYNRDGFTLFDFDVYAQAGDGCMMEGVSSEAASYAAHQRLSNLCWIYDSNRVTIEGHTELTFSEDVAARFMAYGWNVTTVADANDLDQVERAFHAFRAEDERPTLIVVHSHIGYGTPVEDTPKAHGEPLGPEGVKAAKRFYGFPEDEDFFVPDGVYEHFADGIGARGATAREAWEALFEEYGSAHPELAAEIEQMQRRELPAGWDADIPTFPADPKGIASRDSSGQVLNAIAQNVPWLVGGAADLAPSTKTRLTFDGAGDFGPRIAAAATSTSGSASSRRRRSRTGSRSRSFVRSGPGSSSSPTTRAEPSGCPRSWRSRSSTSSRTTRSASARTARRTNRSSSSPRCVRCRASSCSGPATRTRWPNAGGSCCSCGASRRSSSSLARRSRRSTAPSWPPRRRSRRARTSCSTPTAASPT